MTYYGLVDARILTEISIGHCKVQAVLGDMTSERVDAIVNAANTRLAHGGGLAGAIVARGGAVIQEESDRIAPVATGEAAVTAAGDLPCRWVIHAVGPVWGDGGEEAALRSAVRASLDRAEELDAASVALPAISTGIFGYPKKAGAETIVDELRIWLTGHPESTVGLIRLTAFDDLTAGSFADALRSLATFMPNS